MSSYCTRRSCLTIVDSGEYFPCQHNLTQGSTAQESLAKLEKVLVGQVSKFSPRPGIATYDGDCAATSLLALFGTDVDEVLCAGGSCGGWRDWYQYM
jgi:hypothetical protein